jgi:hypothetical protein
MGNEKMKFTNLEGIAALLPRNILIIVLSDNPYSDSFCHVLSD